MTDIDIGPATLYYNSVIEAPYLLASSTLCPNFYDFVPLEPKLLCKLIQHCFKSFD